MNKEKLKELLESIKSGATSVDKGMEKLATLPYEDLGFARIDHHRALRKGFPEVVLGQGKTAEQIVAIVKAMDNGETTVLVSRTTEGVYKAVKKNHSNAEFHSASGMITLNMPERMAEAGQYVAVVSAGTSDLFVVEEAQLTVEAMGVRCEIVQDVGVAGIHRLFNHINRLRKATAIVVVAGMDGALPSAVAGLVDTPVIAVPTSTGYGASFKGISALLAMLNSCASGVTVVNIDNGFGAGFFAGLMLKKINS